MRPHCWQGNRRIDGETVALAVIQALQNDALRAIGMDASQYDVGGSLHGVAQVNHIAHDVGGFIGAEGNRTVGQIWSATARRRRMDCGHGSSL